MPNSSDSKKLNRLYAQFRNNAGRPPKEVEKLEIERLLAILVFPSQRILNIEIPSYPTMRTTFGPAIVELGLCDCDFKSENWAGIFHIGPSFLMVFPSSLDNGKKLDMHHFSHPAITLPLILQTKPKNEFWQIFQELTQLKWPEI